MDLKKMISQKNVGTVDRNLRLVLGTVGMVVGLMQSSLIFTLIGVALVVTGLRRNCGAYSLLGIDTCKLDKK